MRQPILIIDGYNVIGPAAPPGRTRLRPGEINPASDRWLETQRRRLLDQLARYLDTSVRPRTVVVFDAQRPRKADLPDQFRHRDIDVRFAVDHAEADDLIEELIAQHHSPKTLTVVSSDHRLQAAARRRRAHSYDSEAWLDALTEGDVWIAKRPASKGSTSGHATTDKSSSALPARDAKPDVDSLDADEVAEWMREFGQSP
ncbi:MAG: NYN domain-containing protein [Planctomycetota bacterium]